MSTPTKAEVQATVEALKAIAEAIRELKEVPSGHLYARLMGHMSLNTYNQFIGVLTRAGVVKEENHLLTWVGK